MSKAKLEYRQGDLFTALDAFIEAKPQGDPESVKLADVRQPGIAMLLEHDKAPISPFPRVDRREPPLCQGLSGQCGLVRIPAASFSL